MKVKDLKNIKDLRDLREMDRGEVVELFDELRTIASKSATELLGTGKKSARHAIGAPDEGAVRFALLGGIAIGVIVGAMIALVFSPFSVEARERLTKEVGRVRDRATVKHGSQNGGSLYPLEEAPETVRSPRTGAPEGTPTA